MANRNMRVVVENNTPMVKAEMKRKINLMLLAIGEKWRGIVTREITARRIVDTGELRRTMNYKVDKSKQIVEVGSPLDYSIKQELDNPKGPFIKPSILDYKDSYKEVAKQIMEE